jgi:hypothetical protein
MAPSVGADVGAADVVAGPVAAGAGVETCTAEPAAPQPVKLPANANTSINPP